MKECDLLESVEQLISSIRKITEMSSGLSEEQDDGDEILDDPLENADKVVKTGLYRDNSGETNMVNRTPKEERKKMMLIKLKKIK